SEGTLTPTFNSNILNYKVYVPYETTSITVIGTASNPAAYVHNNDTFVLKMGETIIPIRVTAEDGVTELTYRVTVYRASNGSDDATLKSLTVSKGRLNPSFNKSVTYYTVNVENVVSELTIAATATNSSATVTGTGLKPLVVGRNTFTVSVRAQNGNTKNYTIIINRGASKITARVNGTGGRIDADEDFENGYATYNMIPDNGYTIAEVLIDNVQVEINETYTFTNITSDHTIEVQFAPTVGIDDIKEIEVKIYPNPAAEYVVIESEKEINKVTIYNSTGKKVYETKNVGMNKLRLEINSYNRGIYYIDIDGRIEKMMKM
ncbi:cadherin-like beta sandwich domain-containing protein, partial [Bacteroidales bacterium OttesenSCG-928-L14]|nr:cadherin-like beta sandwich domain-containing protein [Bacteroidales bacterium OttesenSCG-928-L14]